MERMSTSLLLSEVEDSHPSVVSVFFLVINVPLAFSPAVGTLPSYSNKVNR